MKKKVYIFQRSRLVSLLREIRIEAGLTQTVLA
jgi:DNA-binding XRE family transcriptional regulator